MKVQIDTSKKVLRLESDINLGEFMSKIKGLLSDWRDYTLETNVEVVWSNPIYIEKYNWPVYPWQPTWVYPNTFTGISTGVSTEVGYNGTSIDVSTGVYNIEV